MIVLKHLAKSNFYQKATFTKMLLFGQQIISHKEIKTITVIQTHTTPVDPTTYSLLQLRPSSKLQAHIRQWLSALPEAYQNLNATCEHTSSDLS